MNTQLASMSHVLDSLAERLDVEGLGSRRPWGTGFPLLDQALGGGLRSGGLALLAGAQGLGKTTFATQVARSVARAGGTVVFFSFEHDAEDLMQRLLALEAGELDEEGLVSSAAIQRALEQGGPRSLEARLAASAPAAEALQRLREYADRFLVHRSSGTSTDLSALRDTVEETVRTTGEPPFVVVDYLQKVRVVDVPDEEERTTTIASGLKDLAVDHNVPVLAIAAADKTALEPGTRMRISHLRGSSALGYEADVVLILNNKYDIVARHHLVYDMSNAERFHEWAVLTVAKNRQGESRSDLEFHRLFHQNRFDPAGRRVGEQLVDERIFA